MSGALRVAYYVRPEGLDHVLLQVLALSRRAEVHLVLETAPETRNAGVLGPIPDSLPAGAYRDAWCTLNEWLPSKLAAELRDVRLHRVVHDCPRAFYPRALALAARAARLVRSICPHVVHFDDTWTRAAWLLLLLGRRPIVANIHDVQQHPGERPARIQTIRRLVLRRTNHVIFHSRYCHQLYRAQPGFPPVPATVAPFGPLDIFRAWERRQVPTEPATILFFGRLCAYKGLSTFVQAAPKIAASIPDTRFIIAGAPERGFVMPALPQLERGGTFEVISRYVPNELTCELFQRTTLVVVPYESASQSGVVMTAYAFGKPVVATRVGGLPEVVEPGETGALVPPGDPCALAQEVVELLRAPVRRRRMIETIQHRLVSDYSWERHVAAFMHVYESVCPVLTAGGPS